MGVCVKCADRSRVNDRRTVGLDRAERVRLGSRSCTLTAWSAQCAARRTLATVRTTRPQPHLSINGLRRWKLSVACTEAFTELRSLRCTERSVRPNAPDLLQPISYSPVSTGEMRVIALTLVRAKTMLTSPNSGLPMSTRRVFSAT